MFLEVRVRTGSPNFKITKGEKITIYCRSRPEKNEANLEIISELKKLTKREVKIVKGLKTKNKIIEICGMEEEEFQKFLG